jgi:hypothetical protein
MPNFMGEEKKSRAPLYVGLVFILIAAVGSTLAANLTLNSRNRIEFGQGKYIVQACQGWIQISLSTGETIDGVSPVTGVTFDSLDLRSCSGTTLRLKIYGTSDAPDAAPLDIFYGPNGPANYMSVGIDNTPKIYLLDANGNPELDEQGVPTQNDSYLTFTPPDSLTGSVSISFNSPLASMESVGSIVIETGKSAI